MKGFLNRLALSVSIEAMAPHTQILHQHLHKPPPFSLPPVHSPLKQPAMAAVHHSQAAGVHLFSSWTVRSPIRSSSVQRHGLPQLDLGFVSHSMRFGTAQCTHTEAFHLSRDDSTTCGEDFLPGSIHLIMGPMFAGKTTALLKRVQAEARLGRNVAMVKSEKDTRYGLADIVSHDGIRMPCWAVPNLASFKSKLGEKAYAKLDVIGIDEAQFLKDLYTFCQVAADVHGKTIIVAGLDGDFLRNRFGTILDLVPLADSVVKLSSHCELCGKPALFTFRKTDDKSKEVIGGADVYMPVCRQHYLSGQSAHETARTILSPHQVDHYHALL